MNLAVVSEIDIEFSIPIYLLGGEHQFSLSGRTCSLKLPATYRHGILPSFLEVVREGDPLCSENANSIVIGYQDGRPAAVKVEKVNLCVQVMPEDGFSTDCPSLTDRDFSGASIWFSHENGGKVLEHRRISGICLEAFDYWRRVLRWKAKELELGWKVFFDTKEWHHQYFVEQRSGIFLSGCTGPEGGRRLAKINAEQWREALDALNLEMEPPVWIDALGDAVQRFGSGDYRGTVLDAIISAESFLRNRVEAAIVALPKDEVAIRRRIRMWQASEMLDNFSGISTLSCLAIDAGQIRDLKSAFSLRNQIMHGVAPRITEVSARSALDAAKALCFSYSHTA